MKYILLILILFSLQSNAQSIDAIVKQKLDSMSAAFDLKLKALPVPTQSQGSDTTVIKAIVARQIRDSILKFSGTLLFSNSKLFSTSSSVTVAVDTLTAPLNGIAQYKYFISGSNATTSVGLSAAELNISIINFNGTYQVLTVSGPEAYHSLGSLATTSWSFVVLKSGVQVRISPMKTATKWKVSKIQIQ